MDKALLSISPASNVIDGISLLTKRLERLIQMDSYKNSDSPLYTSRGHRLSFHDKYFCINFFEDRFCLSKQRSP